MSEERQRIGIERSSEVVRQMREHDDRVLQTLASAERAMIANQQDMIGHSRASRDILRPPVNGNLASEFYKRLEEMIAEFDKELDQNHEVGIRLVSFGQTVIFHLQSLGFYNPSLIVFNGNLDDGSPVQLIQHISQISVLLMALKRKDLSQPKRHYGFGKEEQNQEPQSPADLTDNSAQ